MTDGLLLHTVHGSHLYGMAAPDSDLDVYSVWEKKSRARRRWALQTIGEAGDRFDVDLPTFLEMCDKGVPQALEALFSPVVTVDRLKAMRASWRPGSRALPTYLRTMRHFIATDETKRRRHAVRLALNAADLQAHGRFNPRLTASQIATVHILEETVPGEGLMPVCESIMFGRWPVPTTVGAPS